MVTNDNSYYTEIKSRAREEKSARRDREARRRKLLVDQMKLIQQKEVQCKQKPCCICTGTYHVHMLYKCMYDLGSGKRNFIS